MQYLIRKLILISTIMLGWINMPAQAFLPSGNQNLWPVMSQHFTIPSSMEHSDVQQQIDADLRHPKYLRRLTKNARPYLFYIFQQTEKKHLPAELALLPMIESDYTPSGDSNKGAVGLWQLMPCIANDYGVKINFWYDGRKSTTASTKVALNFLSYLYQTFDHNWLLALAAYNAGPGTVMAAIHYNEARGRPTNFWALPLPKQTREYIPKLLALAAIIQHPNAYGVHLSPVPNEALTSTIKLNKQMNLSTIAYMAHTSVTNLKTLNPALRRSITPPHQELTLVVPANQKTSFVKQLKTQKDNAVDKKTTVAKNSTATTYYHVKRGDTLSLIAKHNHLTPLKLEALNHLHARSTLQVGEKLVLNKVAQPAKKLASSHTTLKKHSIAKAEKKTSVIKKTASVDNSSKGDEHRYIVKSGDNLHRLAAEFHTTTYHIMVRNHLKHAALAVGEHLELPNA